MSATLSRLSTEFVWFKITTAQDIDQGEGVAEVAFTVEAEPNVPTLPTEDNWNPATVVLEGGTYWVRILVGPASTVNLAPNRYTSWVRLNDNPEIVVRTTGYVTIT